MAAAASTLAANVRRLVDERQDSKHAERQHWAVNGLTINKRFIGATDGDSIRVWKTAPLAQAGDVVEFRGASPTSSLTMT